MECWNAEARARLARLAKGSGPAARRAEILLSCLKVKREPLPEGVAAQAPRLIASTGSDTVITAAVLRAGLFGLSTPLVMAALQSVCALQRQDGFLTDCFAHHLPRLNEKGARAFIRDLSTPLHQAQEYALERCLVRENIRRGSSASSSAQRILSSYLSESRHYDVIVYGAAIMRRWGLKAEWTIAVGQAVDAVLDDASVDRLEICQFLIDCCRPFVLRALLSDKALVRLLHDVLSAADGDALLPRHRLLWNFAVSGAPLGDKEDYYLSWSDEPDEEMPFAAIDTVLLEKSAAQREILAGKINPDWPLPILEAFDTDVLVLLGYVGWLPEKRQSNVLISTLAGRDGIFETLRLFRWGFGAQGHDGLGFLRSLFSEVMEHRGAQLETFGLRAEMGLVDKLTEAKDILFQIRNAGLEENNHLIFELVGGLVKNDQIDLAAQLCREEEALFFSYSQSARSAAEVYVAERDWENAGRAWTALAELSRRSHWSYTNAYRAFARAGNAEAAEQAKARIDLSDPEYIPAFPSIAESACAIGDFAFAREMVERAKPHIETYEKERHQVLAIAQMQSSGDLDLTTWTTNTRTSGPRPKALVIDPGFHYRSGHHFNYGKFAVDFFVRELGADASDVWLLIGGDKQERDDTTLDASIKEVFRFNPYTHRGMAVTQEGIENLERAFFRDLCAIFDGIDLSECQAIYVHSMRANMIVGFSRWIARTFRDRPVIVIVGVIEVDYLIDPPEQRKLWAKTNKRGLSRLQAMPNVQALIYCETERAWKHFHRLLGDDAAVHRFPYLAASLAGEIKSFKETAFRGEKITFGIVGVSTRNRGSDLFPQLVGRFAEVEEVAWVLQLSRYFVESLGPDHVNHLELAVERGSCVWYDDRLTVETYYEVMRSIDVMLLPYRDRYAVSGSGVFYEAMQLERFLVVPKQTFMEGVVRGMKYPSRILSEVSLEPLSDAVSAILAERDKHQRQVRRFWREERGNLPISQFRDLFRQAHAAVMENGPEAVDPDSVEPEPGKPEPGADQGDQIGRGLSSPAKQNESNEIEQP